MVRVQVAPISRDIGLISRDVQSIAQFIHLLADRVETGIETAHDMAVRVKAFQIEIQRRIMKPLVMVASVLGGFKQGIETMARIVSRRTPGKTLPSDGKWRVSQEPTELPMGLNR
jgi:hypothetical protein